MKSQAIDNKIERGRFTENRERAEKGSSVMGSADVT